MLQKYEIIIRDKEDLILFLESKVKDLKYQLIKLTN
jgi:hypothetical protein